MSLRNWVGALREGRFNERRFHELIDGNADELSPVFFLSTGRCGTRFFTELLAKDRTNVVLHDYRPEFIQESRIVYESFGNGADACVQLMQCVYLLGRDRIIWKSYRQGTRLIETNNKVSFFAPALGKLFPNAKFVYIHRHPGDFIRSGMSRQWYAGHPYDYGRLIPKVQTAELEQWESWSQIKKIAWLWNETNAYIERFIETLPEDRYCTLNFSELDSVNVGRVLDFLDFDCGRNGVDLDREIAIPRNVQVKKTVEKYDHWSSEQKSQVEEVALELMQKYGYRME